MSRKLYIGLPKARAYEKVSSLVLQGKAPELMYFLPTSHLLQDTRERLALLSKTGFTGLKLVTFNDVIQDILKKGMVKAIRLTKEGRQGLLQYVLDELIRDGALPEYEQVSGFPGIVKSLGIAIGEIKWSGCEPEKFAQLVKRYEKSANLQGLLPLVKIYRKYQEMLSLRGESLLGPEGKLTDSEEEYWLALQAIVKMVQEKKVLYPGVNTLIIEEYNDFNQLQLELIQQLIQQIPNVEIYLPLSRVHKTFNHLERQRIDLVRWFEQQGFNVEYGQDHQVDRSLDHAYRELFQLQPQRIPNDNRIIVQACRNIEKELAWIAKEIKNISYNENLQSMNSICLIVPGLEDYREHIIEILNQEGISVNLAKGVEARYLPPFKELFNLFKLTFSDWGKRELISLGQAGYFSFNNRPKSGFSKIILNTTYARDIDSWLARLSAPTKDMTEGYQEQVEECIRFLKEIDTLLEPFKSKNIVQNFCNAVIVLLNKLQVQDNIIGLLKSLEYGLELYQRDMQFLQLLLDTLKQLVGDWKVLGLEDRKITAKDFFQQLSGYLEDKIIPWGPGDKLGVQILEPALAQGLSYDYTFILGLNQGRWPRGQRENWLLGDDFRFFLEKERYMLPASTHMEEMEQRQFAHCILVPNKKLYMTYQTGGDKSTLLPSPFIEEIQRLFLEQSWDVEADLYYSQAKLWPEWPAITNYHQLENYLASTQLFQPEQLPQWYIFDNPYWTNLALRAQIEWDRQKGASNRWQGYLSSVDANKELASALNGDKRYSATFFNDYASCPFKFFCKRILKLETLEEVEEELSYLDMGTISHSVLHDFYSIYKGIPLKEVDISIATAELEKILCNKKEQLKSQPLGQRTFFALEWREMEERIKSFVAGDIEQHKAVCSPMAPQYFELVFGADKQCKSKPIELDCLVEGNRENIKITGAIDRVDMAPNGDYIIYDYKLTAGVRKGLGDLLEGKDFQLLIYLLAFKQLIKPAGKPLGAAYYSLTDNDRNKGIWLKEYKDQIGLSTNILISQEQWDEVLQQGLENLFSLYRRMREGKFPPNPKDSQTCSYCDYNNICRYNKLAELSRNWQQEGKEHG